MKKTSKNVLAVILSVVLVLSMAVGVMISSFAGEVAATEGEATTAAAADDAETTTEIDGTVVGLVGDINDDGKVNSADARLALRFCARLDEPDELDLVEADANGDKIVQSADARLILRFAAKLDKAGEGNIIMSEILKTTVENDGYTVVVGGDANG